VRSSPRGRITTINPATELSLAEYESTSDAAIDDILDGAIAAQARWRRSSSADRSALLTSIAVHLRSDSSKLAEIATLEMGKPKREALAEVEKCAWVCEYYAAVLERGLADEPIETGAISSWAAYEPLGVILAVMPWNFPYWQVVRFVAPALAVGNVGVLKHSPNVSGCALALEETLRDAGIDGGMFSVILVAAADVPSVTERIAHDDRIAAVTLTGSERAGSAIAAWAGSALKPVVLELGGSDPFIVLEDANIDIAVSAAVRSRFLNGGQSCLAAKRFIVAEGVAAEFVDRFVARAAELAVGDPSKDSTDLGPLARGDLVDAVERQVSESQALGAVVRLGGQRISRVGYYFAPTVMTGVTLDQPVMTEETFGPIAAIATGRDDAELLAIANSTRYGLGASVWSESESRALGIARQIQSGAVFVNEVVASDPRLPFGGVKRSGYGRELSLAGLRQFANLRTFFVGPSKSMALLSE
jgi:succinate-semialdehyde dehydrogenase/glutarate-semialdehyde dehydrogenase